MRKHCASNERIKRHYFGYLQEAKRHSGPTVDAAAKAIHLFEEYTQYRDFKAFHFQQAIGFKRQLSERDGIRSGERLSKSTVFATLRALRSFFQWLAWQPGYKSRLRYADAEYFNLSEKDSRVATARRERETPTVEQIQHVLARMSSATEVDRRNRALIAFTLVTGARDSAIASMKLKHVDLVEGRVIQDAREVRTKFSKTFTTYFFPVSDLALGIVREWVDYLRTVKLWGNDDPLFPTTKIINGSQRQFVVAGLDRSHWNDASPIRAIFKTAFQSAGLPYFNPHSFRSTLVRCAEELCQSPEEFKAWSQNLGHEQVLTTFMSYGKVQTHRQGDIIKALGKPRGFGGGATPENLARGLSLLLEQQGIKIAANDIMPTRES